MQLPDESIEFDFSGSICPSHSETWTPLAELQAEHLLAQERLDSLKQLSVSVRMQMIAERNQAADQGKQNSSAFVDLPQKTLDLHRRKGEQSDLAKIARLGERLRSKVDRVLILGTDESLLAARAVVEALTPRHHNEYPVKNRIGSPRLYYCGNSTDNDELQDLLDLLENSCVDPELKEERWGVVLFGRRDYPLETATTFRVIRNELCRHYGKPFGNLLEYVVPVGDADGPFQELCRAEGFDPESYLHLPDQISTRFAAFGPAVLLPAALMGLDTRAILLGAAAMTDRFVEQPFERNPVLQFAAVNYLLNAERKKSNRLVGVWSSKLESLGKWYEYLAAESLGRNSRGCSTGTPVLPRDLHTIGQRLLEGRRDAVFHQVAVKTPHHPPIPVGMADHNEDDLNSLSRKTFPQMLDASRETFQQSLKQSARPFAEIRLSGLSEHTLGQLMQALMLATVAEAKLMGVNPYGRPGFEAFQKGRMVRLRSSDPKPA